MAKLGHPEGELNLVRAASAGGIMQGVSINASCSLEEMAEVRTEADRPWIFQIYLDRNRAVSPPGESASSTALLTLAVTPELRGAR
jgi:L-lactate dehydrogenase (cytochrome)